jgi:hypothetical protein
MCKRKSARNSWRNLLRVLAAVSRSATSLPNATETSKLSLVKLRHALALHRVSGRDSNKAKREQGANPTVVDQLNMLTSH